MLLRIGGLYKTRDGKKAFVYRKSRGLFHFDIYEVVAENTSSYTVYENGKFLPFRETKHDLIDIWRNRNGSRKEKREKILKMVEDGKTYKEISEELGVAASTIIRAKKSIGYKTRKYDKKKNVEIYKKLLKMHLSAGEIAKKLKKTVHAVNNYIYTNSELRKLKMKYDGRRKVRCRTNPKR